MTPPCPHGAAAPGMCPDCRRAERQAGQEHELVDDSTPGVDHMALLGEDLQRVMGMVGRVGLLVEDATHLLHVARRAGRVDPGLLLRVSEAIADALAATPAVRLATANAIPPASEGSDHGERNSTPLTSPPTG